METRWKNIAQHGQVTDFLHCLVLVRKFEQVKIGIGYHYILGLATNPAAHIDVSVSAAGAAFIHGEANAGFHFFASAATAAGHIEWYRYQVTFFQELDIVPNFYYLARDFVA